MLAPLILDVLALRVVDTHGARDIGLGTNHLGDWCAARRTRLAAVIGTAEISWPDPETAQCFAMLQAACWRDGHPLAQAAHTADAWIAATAIRRNMPLVSHDAVFQRRTEFELITELPPPSA